MKSPLGRFYNHLCHISPAFRRVTHRWMYQAISHYIPQDQHVFMNYGYAPLDGQEERPALDSEDESHRLSYQLYHHLASAADLKGKEVLEVGCGRGGGASMVMKYHGPRRMVGLDYSSNAVELCRKRHCAEGLCFVEGDAEHLPFESESFDAVINVESSHCYGSMERFLSEVRRVLRPEGVFLFADLRAASEMEELEGQILESGLAVLFREDITAHVIRALDEDTERRTSEIARDVPRPFKKLFQQFAGVRDSDMYRDFVSRKALYISCVMTKA